MQISYEHASEAVARRPNRALQRPLIASIGIVALLTALLGSSFTKDAGATTLSSSINLTSQSNWVGAQQGFSISMSVTAPLPSNDLVVQVALYPRLLSRYAFEHSPFENAPTQTLNNISISPINTVGTTVALGSTIQFRVITANGLSGGPTSARPLHIDCLSATCNGNYPLTLTLVNRKTQQQLASLDTSLTYIGQVGSTQRLNVAFVLPLDLSKVSGSSTALTGSQANTIDEISRAILSYPNTPISLQLYGRVLAGLEQDANSSGPGSLQARDALNVFTRLAKRTRTAEFLREPYAPIDINALVRGPGTKTAQREYSAQINSSASITTATLHTTFKSTPYLSPVTLDPVSVQIVHALGACALALPTANIAMDNKTQGVQAPFALTGIGSSCPSGQAIGAAVDPGLSLIVSHTSNTAQLAAHQLLADLAQTYFENPNATATRGVIVAPSNWNANPDFVKTLLDGLRVNPILKSVTLSTYFKNAAIGANQGLASGTVENINDINAISRDDLAHAYTGLSTVALLTPIDLALVTRLNDAIFNGESLGLTERQRTRFFQTPDLAITSIASALHLSGTSHVTMTASTGKIPITIHYTGPSLPVHVDLRISSSKINFPRAEAQQVLVLSSRDTNKVLTVTTRTSGLYTFDLELLIPHQQTVLFGPVTFTITSTAASGVAIALSVGALGVLFLWWSRSILRHRREKIAKGAAQTGETGPTTT